MTGNPREYRDLSRLSTFLKVCLGAYLAVTLLQIGSGWREVDIMQRLANGVRLAPGEASASDARQAILGLVYLIVFVTTAIAFLRWTYLSNANAHAFGATGMKFSPGWAVGWYFVPIATLWKPFQALVETFKASHPDFDQNWTEARPPGFMVIWWMLWVVSNFVGQMVLKLSFRNRTPDDFLASSWISLISDVIDVPLSILVIAVVSRLQAWQSAKRHRLALAAQG